MPGPVFIRGDHVDLHVIEEEDLPFVHRVINDPGVWGALRRVDPATMEDERAFYEEVLYAESSAHLLICSDSDPVGIVGLNRIDANWGVAELGYFVDPSAADEGYATAGVELMSTFAFDYRRLEKLIAYVLEENRASQRVVEKNAFRKEGHLHDHAYVDGRRQDVLLFGLRETDRPA